MTHRHAPRSSVALVFAFLLLGPSSARAEIPSRMEPEYSEAVLSYNAQKYESALKALDGLIQQSPETVEFLELKALALKGAKKTDEAAGLYDQLIRLKEGKADPEEVAPYQFELGVMRFREGKDDDARKLLRAAAEARFNEGPSHFFLGMLEYKAGRMAQADSHFGAVASSSADDLKPPAYFYQAQINAKTGHPAAATYSLVKARNWAADLKDDEDYAKDTRDIAARIHAEAEKALGPLDRSRWFGNVAVMVAHDSNVLALPEGEFSDESLGRSTLKTLAQYSLGYMTSPLGLVQLVPNLRGSAPFHFSELTRSGEFTNSQLTLYATYKPLAPFHFGMKVEGGVTFQNSKPDTRFGYALFGLNWGGGPYFKYELAPKMVLGFEFLHDETKYKTDESLSESEKDLGRSGGSEKSKLFFRNDPGRRFWNPTFSVTREEQHTRGWQFQNRSWVLGLDNSMILSELWSATQSLSFAFTKYDSGQRIDRTWQWGFGAARKISPKVSLTGEFRVTDQDSDDPTFEYGRTLISAGASFAL
ncbi:MAG: tetratricopeptide repeat protein [Bdellovibrionales bacterium]|nr:tetratricopeptide repeat protein [Bdellovibrionales bacterium]